ncbi:hypothetical protein LOTGIDRAFT_159829, partial [Lottia gigantea]
MADENGTSSRDDHLQIPDFKALVEELAEVKTEYEELKSHIVELEKKYERMLSVKSGGGDGEINISARLQLLTADLFNNSMFSDIVIMLQGGTQVKAHKLILAASGNDWGVEQFDTIDMLDLTDMRYEVCYAMIKWVYTDEFDFHHKINDDFLIELMQAASICKLDSLFIRCQKALLAVLNSENYDKILKSSEDLSADILYEQCLKFTGVPHNKTGTELLVQKLKQHIGEQQIDLIIPDNFTPTSAINYRIQSSDNKRLANEGNSITVYVSNSEELLNNVLSEDIAETYETLEETSEIPKSTSGTIDINSTETSENSHLNEMLYSSSLTSISASHNQKVETVDYGPECVDIGPEHGDIGPECVDIDPEHDDIGPEHVDNGPVTSSQHCSNTTNSEVTNKISLKQGEIPSENHYFELVEDSVEDIPSEKFDLGTNSMHLTSDGALLAFENHSNASLQETYVDQTEDSLHIHKDKDSVIIT